MSQSRIAPPPEEFDEFDPAFRESERELVSFLDSHLPQEWEIYVRPHMNGEWPSVAIMHPQLGVVIYDMLTWGSGQFEPVVETVEIREVTYNDRKFVLADSSKAKGDRLKRINPIKRATRYRENLIGIYLPEFGEVVEKAPRYLRDFIAVGLYCPDFKTTEARNLLGGTGSECTVFGRNHLKPEALEKLVVPIHSGRKRAWD